MNLPAKSAWLAYLSIVASLMMAIPFATWFVALAPGVGFAFAGVALLLGLVCGILVFVLLPSPHGGLRKGVVMVPALLSIGLAVVTLTSLRNAGAEPFILTGFGLGYALIMSSAMQATGWHAGYRSAKPNWVKASFSIQSQDPGRPHRDSLPGSIVVGGLLVCLAGIPNPVAAAIGLGFLMFFASATVMAAGAGRSLGAETTLPNVSLGNFVPFSIGVSLALGVIVGGVGAVFSSATRPLLGGASGLGAKLGLQGSSVGASPAPASPPPAIPQWLILLVVAILLLVLAKTSKYWLPLLQRFAAWLLGPFVAMSKNLKRRRAAANQAKRDRAIAERAAAIESPFTKPPVDSQELLDGTEYILACYGLTCRLRDGLRTVYRAATRIGLSESNLRPLFQHLERTAYLAPEEPDVRVRNAFQELVSTVQAGIAPDTLQTREERYRTERATRELFGESEPSEK